MREKRSILKYAIIAVTICSLFTITAWFYLENLHEELVQENYIYLREVAVQSSAAINNKINGDMRMLHSMATLLGNQDNIDVDFLVQTLKKEELFKEFQHVGIILPDGWGYGTDIQGVNFSSHDYFQKSMAGKPNISDIIVDRTAGILSNIYAVPIFSNNKVVAILAAYTHTETYQKILYHDIFDGRGYTCVVKSSGDIVVHSNHPKSEQSSANLFMAIDANEKEKRLAQENMLSGKSGTLSYTLHGESRFLNYVPLGINDWYTISVVPYDIIKDKFLPVFKMATYTCLIVVLVLSILILYIMINDEKSKKALAKLAYYDELTGIANKNFFNIQASKLLQETNKQYAYVVLDINKFKIINDLFGYTEGDNFLKFIAKLLQESTTNNEVIARVSADIFHMLCEYESKSSLERRLQMLSSKISAYSFASDNRYNIFVGFGIYILENNNNNNICIEAMGDKAGIALKKIKDFRYNSCFFYNDEIRNKIIEEQEIENGMKNAIQEQEFKVYLQPKYSLKKNAIDGAEALVRWEHPERGLLSPLTFISLFERNGFIVKLDMYVLEVVCKKMSEWQEQGWTLPVISVNQSRLHLSDPNYINNLLLILEKYNISPQFIELEITESVFFEHSDTMIKVMNQLHNVGFNLSMDDFGAGYSSFNMLQEIMVDVLKIDKNFFRKTADSNRGQKIVNNIISMSNDLGIKTVAEGVETLEQVEFLRQTDCSLVQGYYFYRPITIPAFEKLLFQS